MTKTGMTPKKAATIWKPSTRLKIMRIRKGLSQKDLAIKSGVSLRSLQEYEQRKQIDSARLETLCELSLALNCKIEDILESKELRKKFNATK